MLLPKIKWGISLLLFPFWAVFSCQGQGMNDIMKLHYYDGSNNHYTFDGRNSWLLYEPMSLERSSSGVYSGGEANRWSLSLEQTNQLKRIALDIIQTAPLESPPRTMMSSMLKILYSDRQESMILAPNSPGQRQMEEFFRV